MTATYRTPRATNLPLQDFGEMNRPTPSQKPTPEQMRLARTYAERECPDLIDMLFGGA